MVFALRMPAPHSGPIFLIFPPSDSMESLCRAFYVMQLPGRSSACRTLSNGIVDESNITCYI
jgi:hypothetical protein